MNDVNEPLTHQAVPVDRPVARLEPAIENQLGALRLQMVRQAYVARQLQARSAWRAEQARMEAAAARVETERARHQAQQADTRAEEARGEARQADTRATVAERKLRYAVIELNSFRNANIWSFLRSKMKDRRLARLIKSSSLFDAEWYIMRYPDVAAHGIEPAYDYLCNSILLDRDPSPKFDSSWYLNKYSDVVQMNPLVHYLLFGLKEARQIRPVE